MPTWGEILNELNQSKVPKTGRPDFDGVRRRYLRTVHELTGRAVIVYSSAFLESRPIPPSDLQIGLDDMQGFMEVASNITERKLDLILHSPGGSAEAAESIVAYLRKRFDHIRVFVPVAAMSAATMVALAADEIIMGQHSQLGPIDPQFIISTPEGPRSAPAKAILKQFELAKQQCKDPSNLAAWMPILRSYAPGLLTQCEDSRSLAETMVSTWLKNYMFSDSPNESEKKANFIAKWFAEYDNFRSHGRRVGPEQAAEIGLKVITLESDHRLQDAILSIHHATMHTFTGGTGATKIIENHNGRAWIKMVREVIIGSPPILTPTPPNPPPTLNRGERRRLQQGKK